LGISVEYIPSKVRTKFLSSWFRRKAKFRDRFRGQCNISLSSGLIGGAIVFKDKRTLQITCRHVTGKECSSFVNHLTDDNNYIDISVLEPLDSKTSCLDDNGVSCLLFAQPHSNMCKVSAMEISADLSYAKSICAQGLIVRKKHPNANKICGVVENYAVCFDIKGRTYVNHLQVKPFSRFRPTQLIYKLFGCSFSKPGHSGSWVFDENGRWIGMIVAGNGESSMVLPSWTILDYLAGTGLDLSTSSLILWS
jgi:hypothetical protein